MKGDARGVREASGAPLELYRPPVRAAPVEHAVAVRRARLAPALRGALHLLAEPP